MMKQVKNGNALLAVSVVGLVAMLFIVMTALAPDMSGQEPGSQGYEDMRADATPKLQIAFAVMFIAWIGNLGLALYDIGMTSGNSDLWKGGWMLVNLFCFVGGIIYCLVGRRSRIERGAKK